MNPAGAQGRAGPSRVMQGAPIQCLTNFPENGDPYLSATATGERLSDPIRQTPRLVSTHSAAYVVRTPSAADRFARQKPPRYLQSNSHLLLSHSVYGTATTTLASPNFDWQESMRVNGNSAGAKLLPQFRSRPGLPRSVTRPVHFAWPKPNAADRSHVPLDSQLAHRLPVGAPSSRGDNIVSTPARPPTESSPAPVRAPTVAGLGGSGVDRGQARGQQLTTWPERGRRPRRPPVARRPGQIRRRSESRRMGEFRHSLRQTAIPRSIKPSRSPCCKRLDWPARRPCRSVSRSAAVTPRCA